MEDIMFAARAMDEALTLYLDRVNGKFDSCIRTGFREFDQLTRGFRPGKIVLLASKPGVGKTAYVLNLLRRLFRRNDAARVLYCSAELGHVQLMTRFLSMESGFELDRIQKGDCESGCFNKLLPAAKWIKHQKFWIDSSCRLPIMDLIRKIREFIDKQPLDLIVIDPIELVKYQNVESAITILRQFAEEKHLSFLLLSSFNHENPNYSISGLPSGLEENCNARMFLHDKGVLSEDGKKVMELEIVKFECGFSGTVFMTFDPKTMTFTETGKKE